MLNIKIKNLTKKYNDIVLDDISLDFESNKIYGLLGLNGAGKTTLVKSIFNEIKIDSGEILLNDKKITINEYQKMFYFPENNDLPKNETVKEYLNTIYVLSGQPSKEFDARISNGLKVFKLENSINKKMSQLSTGEQKIVSIIACTMSNSDVIIFDEPTANLDLKNKSLIFDYINSLKNKNKIIIIVTHLIHEINKILDWVVIINDKKIIINESVSEETDLISLFNKVVNVQQNINFEDLENE